MDLYEVIQKIFEYLGVIMIFIVLGSLAWFFDMIFSMSKGITKIILKSDKRYSQD